MTVYELWRKDQNRSGTRKYVTLAEDTAAARFLVATYVLSEEGKNLGSEHWAVGYADEDHLRQTDTPGRWNAGSVWDTCRRRKRDGKTGVVYTYIC